jgi:hypothetical protein
MLVASTAVGCARPVVTRTPLRYVDAPAAPTSDATLNAWKAKTPEAKEKYAQFAYALWWRSCPPSMTRSEFKRELVYQLDYVSMTKPNLDMAATATAVALNLGCHPR